ncbi:MAG: 2'-5' RNA ligase family protein [Planctomycetota bacterium]|nr:2'-5' RNA ligase family protein [Planctomycetota bacterium]
MRFAVELFFDPKADAAVRALWTGVEPDHLTPMGARPHISLGVYASLDPDAALPVLEAFAAREPVVPLSLAFVGTFASDEGVVFLGPQVSPELIGLHTRMHDAFAGLGESLRYYRPGNWVPHCTVAWFLAAADIGTAIDRCRRASLPIAAQATHIGLVGLPDVSAPTPISVEHRASYALEAP